MPPEKVYLMGKGTSEVGLITLSSEEAEACAEAGVDFEVVPSVTSTPATPLYAGIPLTHGHRQNFN